MAEYTATVSWHRLATEAFVDKKYSRRHEWQFDGGAYVPASPSPHIVPTPFSDPSRVDPEEAYVASLSSCHMLFYLQFAAENGWVVDAYIDNAIGYMETNAAGKIAMTRVVLKPAVRYGGDSTPTREQEEALHQRAHAQCFIANSVLTEVTTELH